MKSLIGKWKKDKNTGQLVWRWKKRKVHKNTEGKRAKYLRPSDLHDPQWGEML